MKHLNLRDSYQVYSTLSDNPITINIYMDIVKGFMKFLIRKLFQRGEINIPEQLGKLQIIGRKSRIILEGDTIKGLAPDWSKTKELWDKDEVAKLNKQLVFHFNEETNGVRYKFTWSKNRVLVANKTLYNLRMTRTNKRDLAAMIKQGKEYLIK